MPAHHVLQDRNLALADNNRKKSKKNTYKLMKKKSQRLFFFFGSPFLFISAVGSFCNPVEILHGNLVWYTARLSERRGSLYVYRPSVLLAEEEA